MGMPLRHDGDDFDGSDESLLAKLDELDQSLHAIREQFASRARARARAAKLAKDARVQELVTQSAKRHANGTLGTPDPPGLLDERLNRLTHQ